MLSLNFKLSLFIYTITFTILSFLFNNYLIKHCPFFSLIDYHLSKNPTKSPKLTAVALGCLKNYLGNLICLTNQTGVT